MINRPKNRRTIKFKSIIKLSLIAFTFLLLLASYFYRDDLFASFMDPGEPFQTYRPPAELSYDDPASWLAIPDLAIDSARHGGHGDIFVVTPTLYSGGSHWNAPVESNELRNNMARIITPNYVTPYGVAGRVFAPMYRHASLYSLMTTRDDARAAIRFAYRDVDRAFKSFLENSPPERPIVLVGHGQGGLHVQKLLATYFQDELKARLAAAYIIDHPTPLDMFKPGAFLENTQPCQTSHDTQCVVGFGTFTPKDSVSANQYVEDTLIFQSNDRLLKSKNRPLLCMNPLIWEISSDYAPARLHKGAVAAEGLMADADPAPARKQFGAQCENGLLIIDRPKQRSLRRPLAIGGRYKTLPYNLFYEDLRLNMNERIEALIATDVLPKRAPLLEDIKVIDIIDSPVTMPVDNR